MVPLLGNSIISPMAPDATAAARACALPVTWTMQRPRSARIDRTPTQLGRPLVQKPAMDADAPACGVSPHRGTRGCRGMVPGTNDYAEEQAGAAGLGRQSMHSVAAAVGAAVLGHDS